MPMTQTSTAATIAAPAASPAQEAARARSRAHTFYLGLTVLLIAMVVRGFWATYFGQLLGGTVARHPAVHLHGAVFSGWMALLLAQVLLAATGRIRLHRRIGTVGVAYAVLVFCTGLVVSFVAPVLHVRAGEWTLDAAAAFMLLPLVDMVLFAGFFGTAVAYRRRPEIHKRLVLAATIALAFAAVGRLSLSPWAFLLVWLTPLFIAMAFDAFTLGRVHGANVIAALILATAFMRIFLMESQAWLRIGRAILVPFV